VLNIIQKINVNIFLFICIMLIKKSNKNSKNFLIKYGKKMEGSGGNNNNKSPTISDRSMNFIEEIEEQISPRFAKMVGALELLQKTQTKLSLEKINLQQNTNNSSKVNNGVSPYTSYHSTLKLNSKRNKILPKKLSCLYYAKKFSKRLTNIYIAFNIKNINKTRFNIIQIKQQIREKIKKWLITGETNKYIEFLFSPVPNRDNSIPNYPIWWSGFYIENKDKYRNPIKKMRYASKLLNGYSSLGTYSGYYAGNMQNLYWSQCTDSSIGVIKFNFGKFMSQAFTLKALESNPKEIGYFLGYKKISKFLNTDFYNTEIELINDHYEKNNMKVNLTIFNSYSHSKKIIELLQQKTTCINYFYYTDMNLIRCVKKYLKNKILHNLFRPKK